MKLKQEFWGIISSILRKCPYPAPKGQSSSSLRREAKIRQTKKSGFQIVYLCPLSSMQKIYQSWSNPKKAVSGYQKASPALVFPSCANTSHTGSCCWEERKWSCESWSLLWGLFSSKDPSLCWKPSLWLHLPLDLAFLVFWRLLRALAGKSHQGWDFPAAQLVEEEPCGNCRVITSRTIQVKHPQIHMANTAQASSTR